MPSPSTSSVPPGTCLMHGSFVGPFCPSCSTAAVIPGLNKLAPVTLPVAPVPVEEDDAQ